MTALFASPSAADLELRFRSGALPSDDDLLGDHDGRILTPRWLAVAEAAWAGKRFERRGGPLVGVNRLRLGQRLVTAVRFSVSTLVSPVDGVPRRTLVYPGGLVRDEVVRVEDGILGRGFVGRGQLLVYFSLQRSGT